MNKKSIIDLLVETNDERIEESETRPRVETYLDDFAAWAAYHRAKDEDEEFTPHLGPGWN